jgi:oligosaccharide repeat unit polymerase
MFILLLFLMFLSIVLFGISHYSWQDKIGSRISPTGLYAFIWGTIWFIHWTDIMYYREVSDRALLFSAIPLVAIFVAESLALLDTGKLRQVSLNHNALRRWVHICGGLAFFAGITIFLSSWSLYGNPFNNMGFLKVDRTTLGVSMYEGTVFSFFARYSSILLGASYPAIILGTLQLKLDKKKTWVGLFLPFAGAILYDFGWGSRSHTYDVVVLFAITYFLIPWRHTDIPIGKFKKKIFANWKLSNIVLVVMMLAVAFLSMKIIGEKTRGSKFRVMGGTMVSLSVIQVVDYHVGVLIGFDETLDVTTERTWGRMSFAGIEQWFRLFRLIPRSIPLPNQLYEWEQQNVLYQPDYYWQRGGNVFTWLRYLYSDFGIFGLFIIPFIIGWIATKSAINSIVSSRGLKSLAFLSIWYFVLMRSEMIIMFRNDYFVFAFVLLYYAMRQVVSPSKNR